MSLDNKHFYTLNICPCLHNAYCLLTGVYQAGPAPVCALKNGDVHIGFDGPFIFAEFNGDRIYWTYYEETGLWQSNICKKSSNRLVSLEYINNCGVLS